MRTQLQKDFARFLAVGGYCTPPGRAACALSKAKTLRDWRDAESAGLVRLRAEPEQESYFSVYGEPDTKQERERMVQQLESQGCWAVFTEVNHGTETRDDWRRAGSIGMCAGYRNPMDPFENDYVPDLMSAALAQIPQPGNVDELCTHLPLP